MKSILRDYSKMVMQFGYTVLFASAFPLAALVSLACNFVALRVDTWKLCNTYRRATPRSGEDIGSW